MTATEFTKGQIDLPAVDLLDPGLHASDPHAVWAYMRSHAPLYKQEYAPGRSFWSVTRYDDACRVLGDYDSFTSERGSIVTQLGHDDVASGLLMTSCDPPRHTEVRRPLNGRLTGRAMQALDGGIRHAVERLLVDVPDGEPWDLAERASRLPMMVAGVLLGVPESDWDNLVRWSSMAAAPEDPAFAIGPPNATLSIAHHQMFAYLAELVRHRRDDASTSDLIGHLMAMQAGGKPLSDSEVIYNSYSLLVGANTTTPHTISGTVLAVTQKPETWETVFLRPALVFGLVEEGLRWTSSASSFLRYAIRPTELSGGSIAAGDPIIVWVGSANRDETVFAQPHTFDIARNPNRHIAFGYGPHYCIGAPLARLTIRHLFEQLSRRFESIEIVGEPCRLRSIFINGMTHLSIRTRRRSSA